MSENQDDAKEDSVFSISENIKMMLMEGNEKGKDIQ